MVPKDVQHLLVVGRSIGGDKISHAEVRNMMCCKASGQGGGVAAAVSIAQRCDVVDVASVQAELVRQGVRIH